MIKKYLLLIFTLSILLFGCSSNNSASNIKNDNTPSISTSSNKNMSEIFVSKPTISETIIYDENNVVIKATELVYSSSNAKLNIIFENNTDKDLSFISGSFGYNVNSINSYMTNSIYINTTVNAGKISNDSFYIDGNELMLTGSKDISEIQIGFIAHDKDYNEYLKTGPLTIKTSLNKPVDDDLFNVMQSDFVTSKLNKSISFSSKDIFLSNELIEAKECIIYGNDAESKMIFTTTNTSHENIAVSISDIAVNGLNIQKGLWSSNAINIGKNTIIDIDFDSVIDKEYKNLFNLNTIGTIDFKLSVMDEKYNEISNDNINITLDNTVKADLSGTEIFNEEGILIMYKGLIKDKDFKSNYIVFFVKNTSDRQINIKDEYDSLAFGNMMCDYVMFSTQVEPDSIEILYIKFDDDDLNNCGINSIEDISNIQFSFDIRNENYNKIANPNVNIDIN